MIMRNPSMNLLPLLPLLLIFSSVSASAGDRSVVFQQCVQSQSAIHCSPPPAHSLLSLLTYWRCSDMCRYDCMHAHTNRLESEGERPLQYYGKWPFWRIAGMQEPASVIFSLLNFYIHWDGARLFRHKIPDGHPMKPYYLWFARISMNAWIWSAVFHTRDVSITEKLDYFSAAATILFGLYTAVIRHFHIYTSPSAPLPSLQHRRSGGLLMLWTFVCALSYIAHVLYLSIPPRFDYSYNIIANASVGLIHNILWILYALPLYYPPLLRFPGKSRTYRPSYVGKAGVLVLAMTLAMCLELYDFPPYERIIDAHSLWHLSTVPLAYLWYQFLVQDASDQGWRDVRS